jgi:hypothetical protein
MGEGRDIGGKWREGRGGEGRGEKGRGGWGREGKGEWVDVMVANVAKSTR